MGKIERFLCEKHPERSYKTNGKMLPNVLLKLPKSRQLCYQMTGYQLTDILLNATECNQMMKMLQKAIKDSTKFEMLLRIPNLKVFVKYVKSLLKLQ